MVPSIHKRNNSQVQNTAEKFSNKLHEASAETETVQMKQPIKNQNLVVQ